MINALIKLDENTNRVLNIVKAQLGLKDKSEAIKFVVKSYVKEKLKQMEKINEKLATAIASEKSLAKTWLNKQEDDAWKNL